MRECRANLKDLASEANVTVGTVSKALRNLPGVGPGMRKKILALARKHRYVPNAMARALNSGKTGLIGLVTPSEMHGTVPFESFPLMQALAEQHGKRIIHLPFESGDFMALAKIGYEQQWEGMLLSINQNMIPFNPRKFHKAIRIPVVGVDLLPDWDKDMDTVSYDRGHGVRLILDHAAQRGARTVGLIAPNDAGHPHPPKFANLRNELHARGMELVFSEQIDIDVAPVLFRSAYQTMERVLASGRRADLVMGGTDPVALGVLNCLKDHGCRVPHDVSVTGYDNTNESQYAVPTMTTVQRPINEMIHLAWSILRQRLSGTAGNAQHAILQPALVIRGSTDRPADSQSASEGA